MTSDRHWLHDYTDAWNAHDAEGVAGFMADEVVYEDVAAGVVFKGAQQVLKFVSQGTKVSPDLHFELQAAHSDSQRYIWEWIMTGSIPDPNGGERHHFEIRGGSVGNLDSAGKIASNRDYYCLPVLMQSYLPSHGKSG